MKAPDKIYINAEAALELAYNPGEDDSKEEYIRKEALLEWAKDMNECGATLLAVDTLIDKLNEV